MKPLTTLLVLLLAFVMAVPVHAAEEADKTKAADIANLKKIWEALAAYKKAKGEFPPNLSDLIPGYLPDEKVLLSPGGHEADGHAKKGEYDPKYPCSYYYGFSTQAFHGGPESCREMKQRQLEEFGPATPLLRCNLYAGRLLMINFAGDYTETHRIWWRDPAIKKQIEKYGLGPGMTTGKKLTVRVTDPAGRAIPKARLRTRNRICEEVELPDRVWTADDEGKVTIPLGTDEAHANISSAMDDWFVAARDWEFGDEGTLPQSTEGRISVVCWPSGCVGGIVRDPSGAPLANVRLDLCSEKKPKPDRHVEIGHEAHTDAQGRWTMKNVPFRDTRAVIVISHDRYRTYLLRPTALSDEEADRLFAGKSDLRLAAPIAVAGTVHGAGRPVSGAKVFLSNAEEELHAAATGPDGRFSLEAQEPRKNVLIVVAPDFAPYQKLIEVEEGAPLQAIDLEAGRPLTLRAIRGLRTVVPDLPILLTGFPDPEGNYSVELKDQPVIGTTGADGRFVWKHAPRATVQMRALLPDGESVNFEWDTSKDNDFELKVPDE